MLSARRIRNARVGGSIPSAPARKIFEKNVSLIYETKNFIVESHDEPFVTRTDGGHIRIRIKDESISDRTKLDPATAIELMRLTMIVGEAMQTGMNKVGIPVVKIN